MRFTGGDCRMKDLEITWQRLVDDAGKTCNRCGGTQTQLRIAVRKLKAALKPLGLTVRLHEKEMAAGTCTCDVAESNRIWIAGRPLEGWLGARVGKSHCPCRICDDAECRTLKIEGVVYEAIPSDLIIRAALLAVADASRKRSRSACCDCESTTKSKRASCCDANTRRSGSRKSKRRA